MIGGHLIGNCFDAVDRIAHGDTEPAVSNHFHIVDFIADRRNSHRIDAMMFAVLLDHGPLIDVAIEDFQQMRGRHATFGDCLGVGLGVLLPILGVALLQGLAIGFGFLACFIPGVILAVMFFVAIPAAVEERPGVVKSLERSAKLTEGFRWHVFGVLLVLGGINWVIMTA